MTGSYRDLGVFVALITLGAVLVVLHLFLWLCTLRAQSVPGLLRGLACLPPLAALIALRVGPRVASVLWFVVLVAYLVLSSFVS